MRGIQMAEAADLRAIDGHMLRANKSEIHFHFRRCHCGGDWIHQAGDMRPVSAFAVVEFLSNCGAFHTISVILWR